MTFINPALPLYWQARARLHEPSAVVADDDAEMGNRFLVGPSPPVKLQRRGHDGRPKAIDQKSLIFLDESLHSTVMK